MTAAARSGPVGLAGLGVMGSAMSQHLLATGTRVLGYDPHPARRSEHLDRGGELVTDPAALAAALDIVITSLPSEQALESVVAAHDGLLAGTAQRTRPGPVVLETSTLPLSAKSAAAEKLRAAGAVLLDCPMSGTGQQARDGDLVAFLSGDDDPAKQAVTGVLGVITRAHHDLGAFGNGSRMKFIANLLVAVHNVAAAEALVLARRAGMDLGQVLSAVGDGAGSSRMFTIRGPLMTAGTFDDATMKVTTFAKDIAIITEFADSLGACTPLFAASAEVYAAALAQGRGEQDTASVFAVLDARPGRDAAV